MNTLTVLGFGAAYFCCGLVSLYVADRFFSFDEEDLFGPGQLFFWGWPFVLTMIVAMSPLLFYKWLRADEE